MNICILANGGFTIGMGHITRMLTLANSLKFEFNITFLCDNSCSYIEGINRVKQEGFAVKIIKENLEEILQELKCEVIIIDKYDISSDFLLDLNKKYKIIYIDDNNHLDYYPVDILINQNFYSVNFHYKSKKDTLKLLGNSYVFLRDEFYKANKVLINKDIMDVLITVGGSDNNNITLQILKKIKNYNFKKHVIIGPAFKYSNELRKINDSNIIFYDNPNMSKVMEKIDVAISGCGSTLYELFYLGLPTIGLVLADNQVNNANYLDSIGAIIKSDLKSLSKNIDLMNYKNRCDINKRIRKLIDGNGKERIKKEILNLLKK